MKTRVQAPEAMDIWFAFYNHEILLQQLKAQLKDIGWTDEEIEDGVVKFMRWLMRS